MKTVKSLLLSIRKFAGSNWALVALVSLLLLAAFSNAASATTATGLTVEVSRKGNLVMAEAVTVEGNKVLDESWQWMIKENCETEAFKASDAKSNQGWTATLNADSGDKTYCFYVEDDQGRQAVGQAKIAYPIIKLEQKNDQLVARVGNAEKENIVVDEDSWQWFRYDHIADSRFGCQSQHFNLNDDGLKAAAEAAKESQVEAFGKVTNDVYASQKDVYASGEGSIISLMVEDEGLSYCVRVADSAGIYNAKHTQVAEIVVNTASQAAAKPNKDSAAVSDSSASSADDSAGDAAGEGTISIDDGNGDGNNDDDDGSNWPRVLGFALLVAALVAGIYMLVRASRLKDIEEGE